MQDKGKGAAIPGLTREDILSLQIPCPPPTAQKKIVEGILHEQIAVVHNQVLIERMQNRINQKLAEIWGDPS